MQSKEVRKKFLKFFEKKGHKIVPPSSLLPSDPSVLITTAGMQQFKPYYTGERDPLKDVHPNLGQPLGAKNAVSIQKSFRTSDIDEVGDETHLTFFEMLGNFSFGGYFKEEAIKLAHEFITKELGLPIDYVSVFKGDPSAGSGQGIPLDEESEAIWKSLGVTDIRRFGREDNFWGPTGSEGPCGPTTEIYIRGVEVWNLVFNEYYCHPEGKLTKLGTPGVDTGMGLERLMMVVQEKNNIFETDLFEPLIDSLPTADTNQKRKRIITDHARASMFLISDGIKPSNKEQGYILRRLLRRMIVQTHLGSFGSFQGADTLSIGTLEDIKRVYKEIDGIYRSFYRELKLEQVITVFTEEFNKFSRTFRQGLREVSKIEKIDGVTAFNLYGSLGLTYEIIKDVAGNRAKTLTREDFDKEFEKHQAKSRAGAEAKFGGHGLLLDTGEIKAANEEELNRVLRLHTATHLLQAALRQVLGNEVEQRGSDVNAERTRFDFTFPRKLTPEEIKQVEDLINDIIKKDLPVHKVELSLEEAKKTGALHFFNAKYPPQVKIYYIGNSLEDAFSKEFCNGPHVEHIGEIGEVIIKKEEAVSAGIRRIRAELKE